MKRSILDSEKRRIISLQNDVVHKEQFFLAGGTDLGLRLGHRTSRYIDWFTARPFDANQLATALSALSEKPTETMAQGAHTLRAYYGELETSFLRYTQVTASSDVLTVGDLTLTYFADADRSPLPIDYKVPWVKVKTDLQRGVREWERSRSRGLDR